MNKIASYLLNIVKDSPQPVKRRWHDASFRAEALHLASESCSTQAAFRALNISLKLLYEWQKKALMPVAAARGAELDPAGLLLRLGWSGFSRA